MVQLPLEKGLAVSNKKHTSAYDSAVPTLAFTQEKTHVHKKICMQPFTVTLFIIVPNWT